MTARSTKGRARPRRAWVLVAAVAAVALSATPVAARPTAPTQASPNPPGTGTSDAAPSAIPAAGSSTAAPATSITITGADPAVIGAISVSGSQSGPIAGSAAALPGGQGVVFDPAVDLAPGETVTVSSGVVVQGAANSTYTFLVARPAPHPGLLADDGSPAPSSPPTRAVTPSTRFSTRPDLHPAAVTVNTPSTSTEPGYLFATPRGTQASDQGIQIFDDAGELTWFKPVTTPGVTSGDAFVDSYLGRPALLWFEGTAPYGAGSYRGEWRAVDETYREIGRIRMGNGYQADIHDLYLTSHGTAYLTAYNPIYCTGTGDLSGCVPGSTVLDGVVQEVDLTTGAVLWEWHSLDHVALSASLVEPTADLFDYFHVNSLAEDSDGNVLISGRNVSADYKVDKATGRLIWTFGGKASTFTNVVGDPSSVKGPDYPHHLRSLGDGNYTYFDNGIRRNTSRGAIVHLDPASRTATYTTILQRDPPVFGPTQGTMQTLPGGGHVVGWGGEGTLTEYDPAGRPVFDARIAGPSYRQYRFAWTGRPSEPPAITATPQADGLSVAMSWNGDTRTTDWRVLTGPTARSLNVVATVPRNGFETTTRVAPAAYLSLEALDASGAVIGRSRTTPAGTWFDEVPGPSIGGTYVPLVGDFGGSTNADVVYYAPGSGADYLHVSRPDGTFDDDRLPAINGTYTPLVGDFVGDDRDEILFTSPGQTTAYLWRFDRRGRNQPAVVDSASLRVPATVTTSIVLDNRPAYGGPPDEVLWYAAGGAPDRVDHLDWPVGGRLTVASRPITVNGLYRPVVGDFDGNGLADVFWYAPGSAPDSIWFFSGSASRSTSQRAVSAPVNGTYQVLTGNFSGSSARSELAFYRPGSDADFLWTFSGAGAYTSDQRTTSLTGSAYVLEGGLDRLMTWSPGTSPSIWSLDPGSDRPSGNTPIASGYRPIVGDFSGPPGTSSVLWYAPGRPPERLYRAR